MPLYTYTCQDHGQFSAWGRMSESDAPQPCPSCDTPAPRALARPAVAGRAGEDSWGGDGGCGDGMCASDGPPTGGEHVCGGGCVH
ncbi:MAG TPA: zinc ribbon domain-containing protein [Geminicoccaceae bacterium]|nr:zinc ribbon domain-containing protein [Geminicoccaceae bacterium]